MRTAMQSVTGSAEMDRQVTAGLKSEHRHLTYGHLVPSISVIKVKRLQELGQCVFQ